MPELGKYAVVVLGSYGAAIGLILALVLLSWAEARAARRRLAAAEAHRPREGG